MQLVDRIVQQLVPKRARVEEAIEVLPVVVKRHDLFPIACLATVTDALSSMWGLIIRHGRI